MTRLLKFVIEVELSYGFLSENAKFAERLAEEGIVFIGPPSSAIVSMGSKSESKNIMSAAGVPCVPGYHGKDQDADMLFGEAEKIGYPVLIKAIHGGGGGKGMRVVLSPSQFKDALASAQRESLKKLRYLRIHWEYREFMGKRLFRAKEKPERLLRSTWLEPRPSGRLIRESGLCCKGLEVLLHGNDTRLQVEHPVTEMITGLDLHKFLSSGMHFEARIYAENPRNDFLPDSGPLLYLDTPKPTHVFAPPIPSLPHSDSCSELDSVKRSPDTSTHVAPSMRLEQGFTQGAQIGVFYDPMIAKLVVHGRDRTSALRALRRALEEYKVVGVSTNVEFLRMLAGNEALLMERLKLASSRNTTKTFSQLLKVPQPSYWHKQRCLSHYENIPIQSTSLSTPWTTLTSRRFGGDVHERTISIQSDDASTEPTRVSLQIHLSRPFCHIPFTLPHRRHSQVSPHALVSPTTLSTTLNGASTEITIVSQRPPPSLPVSRAANTMERLHVFSASGTKTTLAVSPPAYLLSLGRDVLTASKGALRAPMPSLVVEVKVSIGDRVEKGQPVVVLESMKTETVLRAEVAGVVSAVGCAKGEMVEEGRELVDIKEEEQ
ncbi:biotin carboxylase C-terminal domain-containing protein [Suillus ampliporus]|nr:biotin carboxylase C-terminal domain-containing protein [Suillus ampliporus]